MMKLYTTAKQDEQNCSLLFICVFRCQCQDLLLSENLAMYCGWSASSLS